MFRFNWKNWNIFWRQARGIILYMVTDRIIFKLIPFGTLRIIVVRNLRWNKSGRAQANLENIDLVGESFIQVKQGFC